jgi:hypothetical protein
VLDGASSKIYTILSVSICNTHATADEIFSMFCTTAGKGTPIYVYKLQPLPALSTFVHNDKIVLNASEELWVEYATDVDDTDGVHVVVSYLDQDEA